MEQISIQKSNLLEAYNVADAKTKDLLEKLFGQEQFRLKITDKIKTFEDACDAVEITNDMHLLLNYTGKDPDMIASQAHMKLTIITKALNEGWTPDWTDSDQVKYYPWPEYTAGVGFSFYDCDLSDTYSRVRSRLCYKSSDLAKYAFNQFKDIYNDFLK